jgi:hypothetical protein
MNRFLEKVSISLVLHLRLCVYLSLFLFFFFLQLGQLRSKQTGETDDSGATVCVVIIIDNVIYSANVGDARAVMCRGRPSPITQSCTCTCAFTCTCTCPCTRTRTVPRFGTIVIPTCTRLYSV